MTSRPRPHSASRPLHANQPSRHPPPKPGRKLPEWNLADLYSGIDAPEVMRDLQKMDAIASRLRRTSKASRGADGGRGRGKWLAEAVRRYEAIDDLAGRLDRYAGLVHAGDSVDPAIPNSTASVRAADNRVVHLLFFRA